MISTPIPHSRHGKTGWGICGINTACLSLDEAVFMGRLVTGARLGHGSGHLAMTTDKGSGEETLQVGEEL